MSEDAELGNEFVIDTVVTVVTDLLLQLPNSRLNAPLTAPLVRQLDVRARRNCPDRAKQPGLKLTA